MNHFDPDMLCPFCAERPVLHDRRKYISPEHVPPRCTFVTGTNDLITVPSCQECNNGTSELDLQFKITMGLYLGNGAPSFWRDTLRSLNKDPKRKKRKQSIIEKISPVLEQDDFGRRGHKLKLEKKPIKTVVTKIAKGLHRHISKHCLPSNSEVTIKYLRQGESVNLEIQDILNKYGQFLETGSGAFKA